MKESVDGIILVLSCQKHMHIRLKEFKLSQNQYDNWKVIYVIGDFFLNKEYEMRDDNYLWIKCEDSYLHIIKKLALSIKYLNQIFDIKEGILRCGDDLIFNDNNLVSFLRSPKFDYYGQNWLGKTGPHIEEINSSINDREMYNYYVNHPEDFDNPQHNVKREDAPKFLTRPTIRGFASGVIFYISNKACKIIVDHMEAISYDVLAFDENTKSYPYTAEDCGIAFIMFSNKIHLVNSYIFWSQNYNPYVICTHTNKYK